MEKRIKKWEIKLLEKDTYVDSGKLFFELFASIHYLQHIQISRDVFPLIHLSTSEWYYHLEKWKYENEDMKYTAPLNSSFIFNKERITL